MIAVDFDVFTCLTSIKMPISETLVNEKTELSE